MRLSAGMPFLHPHQFPAPAASRNRNHLREETRPLFGRTPVTCPGRRGQSGRSRAVFARLANTDEALCRYQMSIQHFVAFSPLRVSAAAGVQRWSAAVLEIRSAFVFVDMPAALFRFGSRVAAVFERLRQVGASNVRLDVRMKLNTKLRGREGRVSATFSLL